MGMRIGPAALRRRRLVGAAAAVVLAACAPGARSSTGGGESLTLSKQPVTLRALVRPATDGHVKWFKQQTPREFELAHPNVKVEFEEVSGGQR